MSTAPTREVARPPGHRRSLGVTHSARVVGAAAAAALTLTACTTTERAARLVVDHHVGMARGVYDVLTGEAEAREQRRAQLQADLEMNRSALAAAEDQGLVIDLLRQHVELQDALISELLQSGHGHHGGGHQQAQVEHTEAGPPASQAHQH